MRIVTVLWVLVGLGAVAKNVTAKELVLATWPNYHSAENLRQFERETGVKVVSKVYGSNEEMMQWLLTGQSGFDVVIATNYAIAAYAKMGLTIKLKPAQLPNFDPDSIDPRILNIVKIDDALLGVPKNWGTTGFIYDSLKIETEPSSWRDFFLLLKGSARGRGTVHDYQLTAIGNALVSLGLPFNSLDRKDLLRAEQLLFDIKPYLRNVSSLAYDELKNGAWISMAWSGDAMLLSREMPHLRYVIASDGGEIWTDFFAIPRESKKVAQAYALINFLLGPSRNAKEVLAHGFAPTDKRVLPLLPDDLRKSPIMFPSVEKTQHLTFGARDTLTDPRRAEILRKLSAK